MALAVAPKHLRNRDLHAHRCRNMIDRAHSHASARTLSRVVWGSTATMRTSTCHCALAHAIAHGYRAAWDTMPRGIPCRVGYRAVWDTVPRGIPCGVGYRAPPASSTSASWALSGCTRYCARAARKEYRHRTVPAAKHATRTRPTCIGLPRLSCSSTSSTTPCPRTRCQTRWPSWILPSGSGLDASDSGDSGLSDIADVRACVGVVARACARNVHARTRVRAVW